MHASSSRVVAAGTSIGESADPCLSQAAPAKPDYDRGSLFTLAPGAFAVGAEGFMIAAILPSIATSLGANVRLCQFHAASAPGQQRNAHRMFQIPDLPAE